jgi:acyl carrier protein
LSSSTSIVDITQQLKLVNSIRSIFCRILDCTINDIDINKSFFEQGGTSLKALQLVALLQQEISNQLNIHVFLDHLSIVDLVHFITKNSSLFQ